MTTHQQRKWGRDYLPDERDGQYKLRRRKTDRASRYWRLDDVTDQGDTSHCVGHAWHNWLAASPIRQRPFLPSGIYTLAQLFDEWEGTDYEGTSVRGAAKVLAITGHITEYRWCWDVATAVAHLLTTGPLVLGVNWYEGMMEPDGKGFIAPSGYMLGGHAVCVYGANQRGDGYVAIRNSWGEGWGDKGNCRLLLADFAKLLAEDGECCAAIESHGGQKT